MDVNVGSFQGGEQPVGFQSSLDHDDQDDVDDQDDHDGDIDDN